MAKAVSKSAAKISRKEWTKRVHLLRSILLVVAGMALMHFLQKRHLEGNGYQPSSPATNSPSKLTSGDAAPPWGELSCQRITLERPDGFVSDEGFNSSNSNPAWVFAGYSRDQLTAFLQQCELSPDQLTALTDPRHAKMDADGLVLSPPLELVRGLSPDSRQKIYSVLAQFPRNVEQAHPFSFPAGEMESWLRQTDLTIETLDAVKRLLYRQGNSVCFCDLAALRGISTDAERQRLLKTLTRVPTLIMKLRVRPDSNIDKLVAYWAKGERTKDVKPLLESLKRLPAGGDIDVAELLPRFARARLYTFPDRAETRTTLREDCGWTSMNFFNSRPNRQFLEPENVVKTLTADYTPVKDHPVFGDILALVDAHNNYTHMCIYIADGVVFTKNGGHFYRPWVLMKFAELQESYQPASPAQPVRLFVFRRKDKISNFLLNNQALAALFPIPGEGSGPRPARE